MEVLLPLFTEDSVEEFHMVPQEQFSGRVCEQIVVQRAARIVRDLVEGKRAFESSLNRVDDP